MFTLDENRVSDVYGKGGCEELTDGLINYTIIERTMGGRIDHTTTNLKFGGDGGGGSSAAASSREAG
jgi:hypothetical protein